MKYSHFIELLKKWDVEYFWNFEIKSISYVGIGPVASLLVVPNSQADFANILSYLTLKEEKFKIIAGMTNLLFLGEKYDGVLIYTKKLNAYYVAENIVTMECGVRLTPTLRALARDNLGGLAPLYKIPGTIGGMAYSNAGAYGKSVSNFLLDALVFDGGAQSIYTLQNDELQFSYRNSVFSKAPLYLISARLLFSQVDVLEEIKLQDEISDRRKASQPTDMRSLGSVFKRRGEIPVSKLIDMAGLKGVRIGGAEISKKHAGFIVNVGNATASDYLALVDLIKSTLKEKFGILPETEIEIIE